MQFLLTHTHPLNYLNAPQRNGSRGFSSHFLFWLSQKNITDGDSWWADADSHTHTRTHTPTLACNCNKWILKHGALLVASMWAWQRHSFQLTVFSCFFSVFSVFFLLNFAGVLQHYNAFWWSPLYRGDFLEGFHLCLVSAVCLCWCWCSCSLFVCIL